GVYCIKFTANKGDESGYTKTPDEGREYIYSGSETISAQTLIVMTNLSIVAKYGKDKVTAWVGDMETAKPVAGAEVMIYSKTNQQLASAQTDENGLVSFSGISADMKNGRYIAKAIKGQDMAYLQLSDTQSWSEQFPGEGNEYIPVDSTRAYVTTERGAYRPGEDVHILALLRDRQGNAPKTPIPVQIKLVNPRYSSKDIGTFTCDSLGCVETTYSLAASAFTGHYSIELSLPEKSTQYETDIMGSASISHNSIGWLGKTSFLVEEFIANRLRVNAAFPEKFYTKADDLKMTVKAEEMFGAPATGRRITASAEFSLAQFVSKNFKDFTFSNLFDEKDSVSKELGEANADAKGNAVFKIENPMISPNGQTKIAVQTTVYDSGRGITVEDSTIFDTAPYHIGIAKLDDGFVELNKPKTFQFVTVDPKTDNLTTTATNSKATVEVFREQWNSVMKRSGSGYQYEAKLELTPMGSGNIQFADNKASWEFTPSVAGMYRIKVTSEDKKDCSVAKFTASSGEWKSYQPWSMEKPEDVEVSFDRPSYKIGDEARVLIKSPFKGTALIGFEQDTPLDVKVFPMDSNTLEVPVKVTKDFAPMTWVSVTVLRPVNPEPKWLPHRAVGYADIRINSEYCQANVDLQLPETVLPGDKLRFKAQVTETNTSAPIAGAEVYLWGVDEGILTLTDFKLENPIDWLFGKYCLMVDTADFYSRLVEDILADNKNATGGDGEANTARFKNSNENKKRVKNVVYWLGKFDTNSSGTIDAELTTPRNFNGSMTMMAVVSTPERIGSAQKNVSVRAPLIIQNNAPRFLATGDKARIAYTLFNTTDTTNTATLNFAAEGIIDIEQKVVSSEPIAPNSSIEVFVDLSTKDNALGEGTITCDGTMGENKASDSVTIPVRPVAPRIPWGSLTIAKASDGNKPINLMSVGNIIPETFLLDLNAGPVAAAQLNGAIKNNLEYPYGCCEQTISRALPFLAIEKAGLAEKIGYNGVFVRDIVQKTIDRLSLYESPRTNLMTAWPGVGDDNLFVSAYALFFLCEARDAGYKIQDDKLKEMAITLSNRSNDDNNKDFMDLSGNSKAFIYYAIVRSKAVDNRKLRKKLSDTADALSPAGQAWLASALHIEGQEELAKTVMAKAVADAGKDINTLNADATGQECFFSNEREIAVPLWACATNSTLTSNTDTLDILSMNLNKLNTNGNWQNTQANAWAVMALAAYESLNKNAGAQDSKGLLLVNGKEYPFDAQKPLKLTNKDINCTDTVTLSVSGEGKAAVAVSASAIPLD
ncbi:MAG: MG2 domain-containing protein, partial [Candidatus Sumerlaeales bacterium]|nr:MG2 domain-containing protein [Candidatus Sumerlaeales bacterium]